MLFTTIRYRSIALQNELIRFCGTQGFDGAPTNPCQARAVMNRLASLMAATIVLMSKSVDRESRLIRIGPEVLAKLWSGTVTQFGTVQRRGSWPAIPNNPSFPGESLSESLSESLDISYNKLADRLKRSSQDCHVYQSPQADHVFPLTITIIVHVYSCLRSVWLDWPNLPSAFRSNIGSAARQ